MKKRLVSLRSAVIISASLFAGTAAGSALESVAPTVAERPLHDAGHVLACGVALWFAERLDRVIDGSDEDAEDD